MKATKIFIIIFIFIFSVRCSETPIIVSSVCDITQEICYYANLVCENFDATSPDANKNEAIKSSLISLQQELKLQAEFVKNNPDVHSIKNQTDLQYRLILIRDELKKLYEQEKLK